MTTDRPLTVREARTMLRAMINGAARDGTVWVSTGDVGMAIAALPAEPDAGVGFTFCKTCGGTKKIRTGMIVGGLRDPLRHGGGAHEVEHDCPDCAKTPAPAGSDLRACVELLSGEIREWDTAHPEGEPLPRDLPDDDATISAYNIRNDARRIIASALASVEREKAMRSDVAYTGSWPLRYDAMKARAEQAERERDEAAAWIDHYLEVGDMPSDDVLVPWVARLASAKKDQIQGPGAITSGESRTDGSGTVYDGGGDGDDKSSRGDVHRLAAAATRLLADHTEARRLLEECHGFAGAHDLTLGDRIRAWLILARTAQPEAPK